MLLSPELRQFLEYWLSLGGGARPPERRMFDLRKLASILRWMFIIEMDDCGTLKFRLAGSCIEDALGCDMTDQPYSSISSVNGESAIMEELYALCLVQGCGLFRNGSFTLGNGTSFDLQVLALPFADERVMGGTVIAGVVRPIAIDNREYIDYRPQFDQDIDDLLVVPSPRVVTMEQISQSVKDLMVKQQIEFRALDVERMLKTDSLVSSGSSARFPSVNLEQVAAVTQQVLN